MMSKSFHEIQTIQMMKEKKAALKLQPAIQMYAVMDY